MANYLKIFFCLCGLLLSLKCQAQETVVSETEWAWAYKSIAVYSCLCELTGEKVNAVLKEHGDISFIGEAEVLGVGYSSKADLAGRKYAKTLKPVFSDDSEFAGRKAIFTSCLMLYDDRDMNKLIAADFKKYKSGKSGY